jgi:hypothetical protein
MFVLSSMSAHGLAGCIDSCTAVLQCREDKVSRAEALFEETVFHIIGTWDLGV